MPVFEYRNCTSSRTTIWRRIEFLRYRDIEFKKVVKNPILKIFFKKKTLKEKVSLFRFVCVSNLGHPVYTNLPPKGKEFWNFWLKTG